MSLDKLDVVPIDVHMHRVAREKGIPEASCKTMATKSYDIISKSLSDFWGNYSGWAQTVNFGQFHTILYTSIHVCFKISHLAN